MQTDHRCNDCGERGLAGETVAVWLFGELLTIAIADEALAQYGVTDQPDQRRLATVTATRLFATPYRSPRLPLWERRAGEWLTVIRVAPEAPRRPGPPQSAWQTPFLALFG
jgi:hypothetical protein